MGGLAEAHETEPPSHGLGCDDLMHLTLTQQLASHQVFEDILKYLYNVKKAVEYQYFFQIIGNHFIKLDKHRVGWLIST